MPAKELKILFPSNIRIRIASVDDHQQVHRALYRLGCGYYKGRPRLAPITPLDIPCGYGVSVSSKGVMAVQMQSEEFEALDSHRELPAEFILLASSCEELVKLVWGSTAWSFIEGKNTRLSMVARTAPAQHRKHHPRTVRASRK